MRENKSFGARFRKETYKPIDVPCLALLIGLAMLAGCGPRWYYPNLDWLIPWYVDDYISLDRDQQSALGERLGRLLDWHCRTQLSGYAGFLRDVRRDVADHSLSVERLVSYNDRLRRYWKELVARIGPEVLQIMTTASDAQIEELFENLERRNQDLAVDFVEPPVEEIVYNRQKRMQKRLRYWFSDLTDEQQRMVAAWSEQLVPISADWIENRRRIQGEFQHLLAQRSRSETFRESFLALLLNPESVRSEAYRGKIAANTEKTLMLLVRLENALTAQQRDHLLARLQSLAEDFDALRCDPPRNG